MNLNFQWLQMYLRNLCLLSVTSLVLEIFPCIPWCFHLLHVGFCRSTWKTLWTSLQVSILHPRHHSSWTSTLLPFLLGYFFIAWKALHQWCHSTVSHNCTISGTSFFLWKYRHIILCLRLLLELSSLVLQNKSHPSFLVGDCTQSFLQIKCISCMVRNIS